MKITEVQTFIVGNPWKNWVFVRIHTDEGVTGVGESSGGLRAEAVAAEIRALGGLLAGEDPRHPERVWQKMYKGLFLNGSPAASAIEIACWDVLGKSLGVPLWQLLGGKQRPRLRVYANGWYQGPRGPSFVAEAAAGVKEKDYTALKYDPFGTAHRSIDRDEERLSLGLLHAVREAVGDDVDILVEGHDRLGVSSAIRVGKQLEELGAMWFETPVMSTDIPATVEVARAIDVPVAVGERYHRLSQFLELLSHRVVDIVQPEPLGIGGVAATRKVAALAEAAEATVALHQAQSPLCTAICTHIHASIPNFLIQECFDDFLVPWAHDIMQGVPRVQDGYIEPSDAPGLGVELCEEEMARHPYGPGCFLHLFEEGWERRRS